uniref:Protein kinase domain-containing protein n=1 Tax=Parastrongyloides trichosuri TaxID=131310 RepID=A0A0N4ZYX6_PARTI
MFEALTENLTAYLRRFKNYLQYICNLKKIRYTIDNIKLLGTYMIDEKKVYTLKSCLVEISRMDDPDNTKFYNGIIRQVEVAPLNMVYFYSNGQFNEFMDQLRQIRHLNINGGPLIFHNKYFLPSDIKKIGEEERLFFVYKRSTGISLTDIITHEKKILQKNGDAVLSLLEQIANALTYLHSKEIVHGELTPDCIHLQEDGRWVISYTGFFTILSHLRSPSDLREQISLYFKSPDSIQSNEIFTKEEDVWAFGIIMYNIYNEFYDYYYECLHPSEQCEPEFCLLQMFENYGPFRCSNKMPETLFNLCAGGIWKKKEERVPIDILYKIIKHLKTNDEGEIICIDDSLYAEVIQNIPSLINPTQKPNYDEALFSFQSTLDKICSQNESNMFLDEDDM